MNLFKNFTPKTALFFQTPKQAQNISLDSNNFYIYLLNIHFTFHKKFSCFKYFDTLEVKVYS
jgi:hypothetical protein